MKGRMTRETIGMVDAVVLQSPADERRDVGVRNDETLRHTCGTRCKEDMRSIAGAAILGQWSGRSRLEVTCGERNLEVGRFGRRRGCVGAQVIKPNDGCARAKS